MVIENVIENDVLEQRFSSLCESNWKIKRMASGLHGNAKSKIDNWFEASRDSLLKLLNISENSDFPKVYHDNPTAKEK